MDIVTSSEKSFPANSEPLDEHFVSLAMLHHLLTNGPIPRERLEEIMREQFGGIDYSPFSYQEFCEAIRESGTEGFQAMASLGYLVLATDADVEALARVLCDAVEGSGASEMPEFIEAKRRMKAVLQ